MTAALHEGARLGVYPQKEDNPVEPLERIGSGLLKRVAHNIRERTYKQLSVVADIRASAENLHTLNDSQLKIRLEAVRYNLLRHGLEENLVTRSFAVISEYASRKLHMQYYDVQLFAAWAIVNGNCAEMATGEGKSFTASLAAATAALAGIPVHVITTNEYLAQRDAQSMRPLYAAMGLSVGTVLETMDHQEKRNAYLCDIVYCTNKQVAFDYLRDRMTARENNGRVSLKFSQAYAKNEIVLRGLCFAIVDEADSVLIDEARTPLILSREHPNEEQREIYLRALALAGQMSRPLHYRLQRKQQRVQITEAGRQWLAEQTEDLTGIWSGTRHAQFLVHQALCALYLFIRDRHYLVRDDAVKIIDGNTGRTMADRSWQKGLQQMVECKEECSMTGQRETLASISYQRFFRRYLYLGGMSGTLAQVKTELREVYEQEVVAVPTHRPTQRDDYGITLHRSATQKWLAVATRVQTLHRTGQPVLIGTGSVRDSELLSNFLTRLGLQARVLSAKQDEAEAEIIAAAGQHGQITVATNMAGRGTDIELGRGVPELGGLYVISTQCHEEYRVDQQLDGRSARQGDPGGSERHVALDDALLRDAYPARLRDYLANWLLNGHDSPPWLTNTLVRLAQKASSKRHRLDRQDVMSLQEKLGQLLAYSGHRE